MPARTLANLGLTAFFDLGENGWDDEMSANLLALSVLTQASAIDFVSATPGAPVDRDVYVFKADHPTQPNKIAVYDVATWKYFTPVEGWRVFNRAANQLLLFDGALWAAFSGGGGSDDCMVVFPFGEAIGIYPIDVPITFNMVLADDFAGSRANVRINPTATAIFNVSKNGAVVGSVSIATTGVATFNTTGTTVALVSGDLLTVTPPAVEDATLKGVTISLDATKGV